jgi:hypothetical protein
LSAMMAGRSRTPLYLSMVVLAGLAGAMVYAGYILSSNDIPFETISRVAPGVGQSERKNYVIRSEVDWKELWGMVHPGESAPPLPYVDFSRETVVAVFSGVKPTGGFSIEITRVVDAGGRVLVYVSEVSPGDGCFVTEALTYPHHIVKVQKSDKPVELIVEGMVVSC